MSLSESQIERYSRQIILPEIGGRGQLRLLGASLWLTTCAEPVASAARYLAGAGVGRIILGADSDAAPALAGEWAETNPDLRVEASADAAPRAPLDLVLASAGAAAVPALATLPWISGGVLDSCAWVARRTGAAPRCGRCAAPADDGATPYRSVALGLAAAQMALEALQILVGMESPATPGMSVFDTAARRWYEFSAADGCALCAARQARRG